MFILFSSRPSCTTPASGSLYLARARLRRLLPAVLLLITATTASADNLVGSIEREQLEVRPLRVILDPGHGGIDPGSIAANGIKEKELTLDIARRVRLFLSELEGVEVHLTRDADVGMSLDERVTRIRDSEADLMVSIHFNHLPQDKVNLVETYYAGQNNIAASLSYRRKKEQNPYLHTRLKSSDLAFTNQSAAFASIIQRHVYREVNHAEPSVSNAGVKQRTLFVLTRSFTPGVLIEMACISNEEEAWRLQDAAYRGRLAAAIADAIQHYREQLLSGRLRVNGQQTSIRDQDTGQTRSVLAWYQP